MSDTEAISKVGKRGTVVIPAHLRKALGIKEGSLVIAERLENGVLIRPAVALPLESYSPEQKAEFILSNAIDAEDYLRAREVVQATGQNPDAIKHIKPPGV